MVMLGIPEQVTGQFMIFHKCLIYRIIFEATCYRGNTHPKLAGQNVTSFVSLGGPAPRFADQWSCT
jgi:hypothetical protein